MEKLYPQQRNGRGEGGSPVLAGLELPTNTLQMSRIPQLDSYFFIYYFSYF